MMNKELTLLETFELLCRSYVDDLNTLRHKDIEKDYLYNEKYGATITDIKTGRSGKIANIGTALKDYLVYKQDYERVMKEKNSLLKEYAKSQKEHKALEIIKKKRVDIALLMSCSCYKQYCDFYIKRWKDVKNIQLPTKKEYNFLKRGL